ncbi:aminotransferase class V-fold PLP-dependent enzyme [Pasteuria penetrans]|uniref:aminotransferase class V-fold PLP-dependent enzyme n=1 Tax=Pasteuria penetrans TaxID=86005 RepID=UPI0024823444|nr:cysteine desulfurase [Pasteuria penetrans]
MISLTHFPLLVRADKAEKRKIYLDSAATSQKPQLVIDAIRNFYETCNANVHRGVYQLSHQATEAYEGVRKKVQHFIHAASEKEIIFTRGATAALNLIAQSYMRPRLQSGDVLALTMAEHHSNLVPWQQLAKKTGAELFYVPMHKDGTLDMKEVEATLPPRIKMLAIQHLSNVTGVTQPIRELADLIHHRGGILVVDAAQSVPHMPIDVRALGVDFLVFSGHKMCGPTGVGVCYGRETLLEEMEPYEYGGEMIENVELYDSTFKDPPARFEGGTPMIASVVGLGAAIDYLESIGMKRIAEHDSHLTQKAAAELQKLPGITLFGPLENRYGAVTFNVKDVHAHDVATVLDEHGVMVRGGAPLLSTTHALVGGFLYRQGQFLSLQ